MRTRSAMTALVLLCSLVSACSRKDAPGGEDGSSKYEKGWKTYQDERVRVSYPEIWRVRHFAYPKGKEHVWAVEPPGAMEDDTGSVMISEKLQAKKRSLEEFVANEKKYMASGRRFINPPKKLKLKVGNCVSYPMEYRRGNIFSATIQSHCYRDNGNYVSIWADIGKYTDNTKPDEDSLRNARIYERVLESLEFL